MIIDVMGLQKKYGTNTVVDGVDLEVPEGQRVGLLGPNGAGKTTLIKLLAGLLVPDGGAGSVCDCDLFHRSAAVRARVGLVAPTADVGTDNNLTVRQNLDFWAMVYGLHGRERVNRVEAVLELVDLREEAETWPMYISAGMRQRLAIARALLAENRLLFLDEPTIKLDVESARRIRQFVREINQRTKMTIVLTSHLMFEAEELCHRILVMHQGRIVADGTPAELKAQVGANGQIEALVEGIRPSAMAQAGYTCKLAESRGQGMPPAFIVRTEARDVENETANLLDRVTAQRGRILWLKSREVTLEDVFFHFTGKGLKP